MDVPANKPIYAISAPRIDGSAASLSEYAGNVMLIVNVASKCGLTPQYEGLEKLYAAYRDKGLVVLGFPANNFSGQEPGTNEDIQTFCRSVYGVDFPMFTKISVRGDDQSPLYDLLTALPDGRGVGGDVQLNFEKFVVARDGSVIGRFSPDVAPDDPGLNETLDRALAG